jgi:N-acyl-L-homoserine lactone synthetase
MSKLKEIKRNISFWWFYKSFFRKFSCYITSDSKELEELYRIRYEVYCKEYGYIPEEKTKNNMEFDEWDAHSVHFIIRDIKKEISATVRLILNSQANFPIQKHFKFDVNFNHFDLNKAAEISRLIVIRKYRKHHLMFLLIKGIYIYIKKNNIEHIFSVMDDKLFPLLTSLGVPFKKIGPPSLYQGLTFPCILNCKEFETQLKTTNKRLFHYLTEGMQLYKGKNNYSPS